MHFKRSILLNVFSHIILKKLMLVRIVDYKHNLWIMLAFSNVLNEESYSFINLF